jgi:hypothetical protein
VAFLFKTMKVTWNGVFGHNFAPTIRSLVFELADDAKQVGAPQALSTDDTSGRWTRWSGCSRRSGNVEERKRSAVCGVT